VGRLAAARLEWWIAYNLYFPLVIIGLWPMVKLPEGAAGRTRLGIDVLIVIVATAALAWYFVFRLDEASQSLPRYLKSLGTLFLGELLVVGAATAALHRPAPRADLRSLTCLSVGLFVAAVADFLYEHDRLVTSAWSATTGDWVLALGTVMVTTGGLLARGATRSPTTDRAELVVRGLTAVPYLAIAVLGGLLFAELNTVRPTLQPIEGLVTGGALLLVLLIVRLLVAQRELRVEAANRTAQDARFTHLVQRSSDGVVIVSDEGVIRYASPAFGRLVRAEEGALLGRRLGEFVAADQTARVAQWLSGRNGPERWRFGDQDIEAVATDLRSDPAVGGIVVNTRDVSERVRLENQLRQAETLEVVGRLASSVAHDFNNILAVILGNVRLSRAAAGPQALGEEFADIEAAAERGAILSRQLLSLSRPAAPVVGDLELDRVVDDLLRTLGALLPSSIVVSARRGAAGLRVRLAMVQLEQLVLNLAVNARDSMPQGGTLTLEVDSAVVEDDSPERRGGVPPGRWCRLAVIDSGTGMDAATLARAFEPFFTTKPTGQGTGRGLATVKRIAREAGGYVSATSAPNRGTTVALFLPLAAPAAPSIEVAQSMGAPPGHGRRVLLVEDEPALRRILEKYLKRTGYQVYPAADGAAALTLLQRLDWKVDLVLTDLVMPNLGGVELARRVAAARPELPILCMSGHPAPSESADDPWSPERTIVKPATLDSIGARVSGAIAGF